MVTGISYNGVDKDGRVDWNGVVNVKLIDLETSTTFQVYTHSLNFVTSYNTKT